MLRVSLPILLVLFLSAPTGGSPARIHSTELFNPKLPSTYSLSLWTVASHKHRLLMHWTCTAFEPVSSDAESCNASMWLQQAQPQLRNGVKVIKPFDRTNLSEGRNAASVIAKSYNHRFVTSMKLIVGIDDPQCPAGEYCTNVKLTVSAF